MIHYHGHIALPIGNFDKVEAPPAKMGVLIVTPAGLRIKDHTGAEIPVASHTHPPADMSALATKAELSSGLDGKADATALSAGLALKADQSALTSGLATKQDASQKGQVNGYAGLDATGKVPTAQLPAAPTVDAALNGTSTNAIQNKPVFDALALKASQADILTLLPFIGADAPVNSGTALTLNFSTGKRTKVVTLTGNVTLTLTPPAAVGVGPCWIVFRQDATGGRTVTYPASLLGAGQPTGAANSESVLPLFWSGSSFHC